MEPFVAQVLEGIRELDQRPLTVDEHLHRPFEYHLWHDLDPDELVRLFILLNAGQQKVSARHSRAVVDRKGGDWLAGCKVAEVSLISVNEGVLLDLRQFRDLGLDSQVSSMPETSRQ